MKVSICCLVTHLGAPEQGVLWTPGIRPVGQRGAPGGDGLYLQIGILHQLELLLDDVQLLLLRLDVRLQNARPLFQLLLQLMHHPQLRREVVHGLWGTESAWP